jgi:hypothetical protein
VICYSYISTTQPVSMPLLTCRKLRSFAAAFRTMDGDSVAVIETNRLTLPTEVEEEDVDDDDDDSIGIQDGVQVDVYMQSAFISGATVRFARTGCALPLCFLDGTFMKAATLVSCLLPCCLQSVLCPS